MPKWDQSNILYSHNEGLFFKNNNILFITYCEIPFMFVKTKNKCEKSFISVYAKMYGTSSTYRPNWPIPIPKQKNIEMEYIVKLIHDRFIGIAAQ